jgi:hypothetical protein
MKKYFYEAEGFGLVLDESMEAFLDDDFLLDVAPELMLEYKDAKVRFEEIQNKLYAIRLQQKGY